MRNRFELECFEALVFVRKRHNKKYTIWATLDFNQIGVNFFIKVNKKKVPCYNEFSPSCLSRLCTRLFEQTDYHANGVMRDDFFSRQAFSKHPRCLVPANSLKNRYAAHH